MLLILLPLLLALAAGCGIKLYLDQIDARTKLSWIHVGIGGAICLVVVLVGSGWGKSIAKGDLLKYNESYGGFEVRPDWDRANCHIGSDCIRTFECNSRQVSDNNGTATTASTSHEEHDDCPYVDQEWNFSIDTTLGRYTIANGVLPPNPGQHRWTEDDEWDNNNDYKHYPTGVPPFWSEAKARFDRGDPGPVVQRNPYDNFVLAASNETLKKFSASIDRYAQARLMPKLPHAIYSYYRQDKVIFVGLKPPPGNWQEVARRFDAALGTEREGDLYVVIVNANRITNPSDYAKAIEAHWQSKKLGRNALSKNGIGVVIGTKNGRVIEWARGFTGMPVGNTTVERQVANALPGTALTPVSVFGNPKASITLTGDDAKVKVQHTQGSLENVIWGNPGFVRIKMTCKDKNDHCVGFKFLEDQIQASNGTKRIIGFLLLVACLVAWGALYGAVALLSTSHQRGQYGY